MSNHKTIIKRDNRFDSMREARNYWSLLSTTNSRSIFFSLDEFRTKCRVLVQHVPSVNRFVAITSG